MYMGTKYAFYLPSFSVRKESSLFCESWTMVFKMFGIYIDMMMLLIINNLKYILLNIFFMMKN